VNSFWIHLGPKNLEEKQVEESYLCSPPLPVAPAIFSLARVRVSFDTSLLQFPLAAKRTLSRAIALI